MKNQKYFKSVKFTNKHHLEISELLYFQNLNAAKQEKYLQNFEKFFCKGKSARFLYIIQESFCQKYKIGITNNLNKRLSQLQTGNPNDLHFVACFHSEIGDELGLEIMYLEKFLHKNYKSKNIRGEWYELDVKEVVDICIFMDEARELFIEFSGVGNELEEYDRRIEEMLEEE